MSDRDRPQHLPGLAAAAAVGCLASGLVLLCALVFALLVPNSARANHAIAMHGEPALAPGFAAFRYVNPDAPKGGRLAQGVLGTFDSLNPFIVKGLGACRNCAASCSKA